MSASTPLPSLTEGRLDETFSALANTTRRAILARLVAGEASVNGWPSPSTSRSRRSRSTSRYSNEPA